ncbi:MAG: hypothetical protein HY721_28735 [Planctomycetes bacterium]|nr:hypothetical protein [Planctomycetota bacterium]
MLTRRVLSAGVVFLVAAAVAAPLGALDVPLRIKMGGPGVVDSFGRTWLGDEGAGADPHQLLLTSPLHA